MMEPEDGVLLPQDKTVACKGVGEEGFLSTKMSRVSNGRIRDVCKNTVA